MVSEQNDRRALWSNSIISLIDPLLSGDVFRPQVTDQCSSFVWTSEARVNFTVYYESLCADCRQFTIHQVWNAFQAVLEIVNLTLVPYGNAREVYRPETQLYQFYCQHGADECYGNLIHVSHRAISSD